MQYKFACCVSVSIISHLFVGEKDEPVLRDIIAPRLDKYVTSLQLPWSTENLCQLSVGWFNQGLYPPLAVCVT